MAMTATEIHLKSRPVGLPSEADFEFLKVELPAVEAGQVLVKNEWLSVDPSMRGRMYDAKSYVPAFELNSVLEGPAVGRVVTSKAEGFSSGDLVYSEFGWRDCFVSSPEHIEKIDTGVLPPQAFLGMAGIPGLTAYVGLMRIAELKPGDVVFISAASGAVGSMACQIAKLKGCTVIASAGGEEKIRFLVDTLGVDEVIDYKAAGNLTKALAKAAPQGIDVYFDNVGGDHLQAAINVANRFARFAICGMISQYNLTSAPKAPNNLMLLMAKAIRMQGYIVLDHLDMKAQFMADLFAWYESGKLKLHDTVYEGLEKTPQALMGLFSGANIGKMLVRL